MALIQINQKLLHITITLLIYGVHTKIVKCPDVCHCVETSVYYNANATQPGPDERLAPQRPDPGRKSTDVTGKDDPLLVPNEIDDEGENKTAKNNKNALNDIFIRNFSTGESSLIKNSKEIRIKRTLKLNESFSNFGAATAANPKIDKQRRLTRTGARDSSRSEDGKEFFTYQITCKALRDLGDLSVQDLPNPTTQLIIQGASFSSVGDFFRFLKDSSLRLVLLTDLSITNAVIDAASEDNATTTTTTTTTGEPSARQKFQPFASLQNPKLRDKNATAGSETSKLLVILNLSNNTLACLPRDVFKPYPNLQTLDLSNNLIEKLDDEVFGSVANLLRLDLHSNRISILKELIFKNLTKLLTLDLSKNSISNIAPSTFQYLTSLNTLILSDNPLSVKQQSMILLGTGKRLQIVDASKTGLKQIPGTLERSVQTLNLRGNYLSSIQCGDLDSYSLLTYLDLGNNKISYVEDDALGRLELLNNLRINENNLFQIPKSLPNNLEILNLSYNNIQNVTNSDFLNLSLLKELYISYNQVNNIEENSFDNLGELRILDLSHNPILILPNMYGLVKLTTLNLSYFTNIPNHPNGKYEEFPAQAPENIRVLNLESSPLLTRTFLQDTKTLQSFLSLEELYLRFTNLTTLRKDIFSLLPRLRILRVEGNPWQCDREILKLSEWLKNQAKSGAPSTEDANEVNTAHCATPSNLHKKPLLSLTPDDFAEDPSRVREMEKLNFANRVTVKEIQSKIYFKSSEKAIDYRENGETQNLSNASRKSEVDLTGSENSLRKDNQVSSNFILYNKTVDVISDNDGDGGGGKDCCGQNSSTSAANKGATSEITVTVETTTNGTALEYPNISSSWTEESITEASYGEVTKAEAMHVKDTSSSNLQQNTHPRLILVTFVGAVLLATTAVTILHFARSRKDRNYERQTHDIEVHSISSIGNELW